MSAAGFFFALTSNLNARMERMTYRHSLRTLVAGAAALGLVAVAGCSDDGGNTPNPEIFTATLTQLNGSGVSGNATFTLDGDSFEATVNGQNLVANIGHAMHIHAAASCPGSTADANSDGYIDVVEGVPSYGGILVPLDGDLSSQSAGLSTLPDADPSGNLTYDLDASLSDLVTDLQAADPDPSDAVVKLAANEDLGLSGRTIVVHGISDATTLPGTVQTQGGLTAQQALPVACGEIN
jgi:hypothetical protein